MLEKKIVRKEKCQKEKLKERKIEQRKTVRELREKLRGEFFIAF